MQIDEMEIVREITENHGKEFELYYEYLIGENAKYNLTSVTERDDVFIKHFADSCIGAGFIGYGAKVMDIGSGAGFPGVPLKIVRPDLSVFLVESIGKKCSFLNSLVENLLLSGVQVFEDRAELLAGEIIHRERYDCVTARAVAPLNSLCELALPFVRLGGKFLAYKGKDVSAEIDEAQNALLILGGKIYSVVPYELPRSKGSRNLIVIEKVSSTPPKFPRGKSRERKNPL
ncbi:MAG: 16S rRNA (guanine(527)-N(7))-methyltransferase RsmG [Bacteroidales bacterium]|nr:16S rRNA (guanine(527)-N(7))-methyltransferase RsmG [Bacteroidales bacterium]